MLFWRSGKTARDLSDCLKFEVDTISQRSGSHDAPSSRTVSPTHYQRAIAAPKQKLEVFQQIANVYRVRQIKSCTKEDSC